MISDSMFAYVKNKSHQKRKKTIIKLISVKKKVESSTSINIQTALLMSIMWQQTGQISPGDTSVA